ncbi:MULTISPECIES: bifunctional nuclease domain-containing protein [unclassified Thioalkalivibrio]|uniref:bifunctional nuclease domain-containing protein n=1 Tax=unclassified Thioalkalivibrio TaxID=2621013 RepID=UPI00035E7F32|nr:MULTISPECIES: bifunctional nuclease domain-containing protein [unclassified Thioalkalivibrio]
MRSPRLSLPAVLVLLLSMAGEALAREMATDPDRLLPVELATVGLDANSSAPIALLRHPASGEVVPIVIGTDQARAILLAMHEVPLSRPQTHDLMIDLLDGLDARLERVIIDGLENGTYLGWLEIRVAGEDEPRMIDTRPSDGLALAVRSGASIHVAPEILEAEVPFDYTPPGNDEVVTALGITVVEARDDLREALQLPDAPGVLVSRAVGRAAGAGLSHGALILEVNGQAPVTPMDFLEAVSVTPEGEEAEIHFWLDGETRTIHLPTDVPAIEESDDALTV